MKRQLSAIIYLLLLLSGIYAANAQTWNHSFKYLTSDQGLPSNRINCIFQDKLGFMWFGTQDGLARYDSYNFEVYRNNPDDKHTLSNNEILCITEEPGTGNLWIGTNGGINYFDQKEGRFVNNVLVLPNNDSSILKKTISSIIIDHKKQLWIVQNSVVYCYSNYKSAPHVYRRRSKYYIPDNRIQCIFQDSKHNIWIGTRTQLCLLDSVKKRFKHVNLPVDTIRINSFFEDSRNNLWLLSRQGVIKMKGNSIQHFTAQNSALGQNRANGAIEDARGNIWFVMVNGNGLIYYDGKMEQIKPVSPGLYNHNSLNSKILSCIFKDRDNNIWLGTYGLGINFIDRNEKPFNHYSLNKETEGLNSIRSVFQDRDGEIWIGTRDQGGLYRFSSTKGVFESFKASGTPFSLNDDYVLSIADASQGKLLIGTFLKGMIIFDKKSRRFYPVTAHPKDDPGFSGGPVYQLTTDRYDSVWVSNQSHAYTFNIKTNTFKPKFSIPYARKMLDFSENEIYMITSIYGLYRYNRKKNILINYRANRQDSTTLADNHVSDLVADNKGNIWLATNSGVCVFNPKTNKFKTYTTKHGLPSNIACGLLIDGKDNVWISTTKGLAKFNPSTMQIRVYTVYDGLQGNEFERQVCYKTTTGFMLFGGRNGFNYFHPDSIKDNPVIPNVVITDFKLFNKSVKYDENSSFLDQTISFTKDLTLTHKQSVITFEFTALNYTSPENNQFAYKLDGLEDDWNYVGNKRNATYTSLPPGKYTFMVKASNNDGIWNTNFTSVHLIILPPWWKTWWFRVLVITVCIGFFFYRTRTLTKQKLKLELMVKDRTRQIEIQNNTLLEQKKQLEDQNNEIASQRDHVLKLNSKIKKISELRLQFFTNVSHEFRTPLSLIIGPVDNLLSSLSHNDEIHRQLLLIKRNSNRLLGLVTELMDFRNVETQNIPLRLTQTNIVKFAKEIANCFSDLARQQDIHYTVSDVPENIEAYFDTNKLEKIIYNLISNAFKYTNKGGNIEVLMREISSLSDIVPDKNRVLVGKTIPDCNYFELSVIDNGVGIESQNLHQIFREFYREPSANTSAIGTGIGLALTRKLVIMHKGTIEVASEKNKGSVFTIRIPLDKRHFDKYTIEENTSYTINYSKTQLSNLLDSSQVYEPAKQAPDSYSNKTTHLLIVEDNLELRNFIASQFSQMYRITEASNGAKGLAMAVKYTPDLIISDVMMPEMNGIELCSQLKTDLRTCHIPVILLTALSDSVNQVTGFETGADDYISKPFDLNVLRARINNLVQSRNKLRQLFSTTTHIDAKEITTNSRDERFLQKAIDIVTENLSNPDFGAIELIDKMGVSRSVMYRKLISLTNQSAVDFITTSRLKEAVKLMNNPDLNITDIAAMVGFNDPKYFSTCFRKHFGKPPKEYVNMLHNF